MTENNLGDSPAFAEELSQTDNAAEAVKEATESADPAPQDPPEDKIQKRFDKLTKEKYDAQRRADRLAWELEQLKSQPAKPEPVAPVKPTLESSGYDEDKYQTAVIEYAKQVARAEAAAALQEDRDRQAQAGKQSEFEKRQAEFAKSKPDYVEKVMENQSLPITQTMADVIRESDVGPQVAYHLAENPEIAASIAKLPPLVQAREIGRIEARIEAQKAAPAPKVSSAPPPSSKIEASDASVSVKTTDPASDKLSDEEWFRAEKKRMAKQFR